MDSSGEIRTADEKIDEAPATLNKIDSIERTAGLIFRVRSRSALSPMRCALTSP
jgi:hypothetical protein